MIRAESTNVTKVHASRTQPTVASICCTGDSWALANALVFDSRDHLLHLADIEIAKSEIVGVTPAGTSCASRRIDASGMLCAPGLVDACVTHADEFELDALSHALARGVTTAACFTTDALGDMRRAAHVGSRVVLLATFADRWVGPGGGPTLRSTDACLLEYEHVAQAAGGPASRVSVVPAIGSQLAVSPRLVVALHEIVRRRRGRLAVCLDGSGEHATQFHDAYGCSGVALLRSLDALDSCVLAFPVAPLSSHERRLLCGSGAHVVGITLEQGHKFAALAWTAAGGMLDRWLVSRHKCRATRDAAADLVNALTWGGARALGLGDAGCIATGQRADLLLYGCPDSARERPAAFGAAEFLDLIACKRPSGVLAGGRWMTGAIRFAC